MSTWQFMAAVEGFAKKQAGGKDTMSSSERDAIWDWISSGDAVKSATPRVEFNPSARLPVEAWG
jgi:hypothetical protein